MLQYIPYSALPYFIVIALLLAVLTLIWGYWMGLYKGAIYVPATHEMVADILRVANLQPGERVVDIGSGDGRIIIAAAKLGNESHGFEINPGLVRRSRAAIRAAGLQERAMIHAKNFWREDYSKYQVVIIYGLPSMLRGLEKKLKRELQPGARIICNIYPLPHWPSTRDGNIYTYIQD